MNISSLPQFTEPLKKNDSLFLHGSQQRLPWVMAYEQKTIEVVAGPACKPDREINLKQCELDGVGVVPRRGGGGTVVLCPGTVVLVVVGTRKKSEEIRAVFNRVHTELIDILHEVLPLSIQQKGISDLAIDDKKILGSSLYLSREPFLFYYQSSLLVSADVSLFQKYLNHPPREPDYRAGRAHGKFCTTLAHHGWKLSAAETALLILENLKF